MTAAAKALTTGKGLKSYRALILAGIIYAGDKLTDLDKRVAVIESRIVKLAEAPSTNFTVALTARP